MSQDNITTMSLLLRRAEATPSDHSSTASILLSVEGQQKEMFTVPAGGGRMFGQNGKFKQGGKKLNRITERTSEQLRGEAAIGNNRR